jgi:hypothetical protein
MEVSQAGELLNVTKCSRVPNDLGVFVAQKCLRTGQESQEL